MSSSHDPLAGRRPYTAVPTTVMELRSEDLMRLTDQELVEFADKALSIVIPPGTKRTVILTKIVNAAIAVRDDP
jgi:hypothetical protein